MVVFLGIIQHIGDIQVYTQHLLVDHFTRSTYIVTSKYQTVTEFVLEYYNTISSVTHFSPNYLLNEIKQNVLSIPSQMFFIFQNYILLKLIIYIELNFCHNTVVFLARPWPFRSVWECK